jgi:hypothetical protein
VRLRWEPTIRRDHTPPFTARSGTRGDFDSQAVLVRARIAGVDPQLAVIFDMDAVNWLLPSVIARCVAPGTMVSLPPPRLDATKPKPGQPPSRARTGRRKSQGEKGKVERMSWPFIEITLHLFPLHCCPMSQTLP